MAVVPTDLFAFGNRLRPRKPRPGDDVFPDAAGRIGPEDPKKAHGASTFADPLLCPLNGHYHRLPAGTILPGELGIVADGVDVDSTSEHEATHHTIYPGVAMPLEKFVELFLQLPWRYVGRK